MREIIVLTYFLFNEIQILEYVFHFQNTPNFFLMLKVLILKSGIQPKEIVEHPSNGKETNDGLMKSPQPGSEEGGGEGSGGHLLLCIRTVQNHTILLFLFVCFSCTYLLIKRLRRINVSL